MGLTGYCFKYIDKPFCLRTDVPTQKQKGLIGYCFKHIDRPFCLQTDAYIQLGRSDKSKQKLHCIQTSVRNPTETVL